MTLRAVFDDLVANLLPDACAGCGRAGVTICSECGRTLAAAPALPPPPGVSWWSAAFAYEGVARELVARAKYRGARRGLRVVLPGLVLHAARVPTEPDVITWAPASNARRRLYGVDNAELLARAVGKARRIPVQCLLRRSPGVPQTGLDRHSRRRGPDLRAAGRIDRATVLVVDDVATTGGTLAAAARALRGAGAHEVYAVTVARTRPPWAPHSGDAYTAEHFGVTSMGRAWT